MRPDAERPAGERVSVVGGGGVVGDGGGVGVARAWALVALIVSVVLVGAPAVGAAMQSGEGGGAAPEGSSFFFFDDTGEYAFDFDFYPSASALGDLDADGWPDLVVAGRNREGLVAILPGEPGGFGAPTFLAIGSQTTWAALHDFDGDAVLDLVLSLRTAAGQLVVLTGAGDGTFVGRRALDVGREPAEVVVGDLTGDGIADLATAGYGRHEILVHASDGAGGFAPPTRHPLADGLRGLPRPFALELADVDGDGDRDLVAVQLNSGHVTVLPLGPTGLGPARRIPIGAASSIATGDVDGDGDADLVMPTWASPFGNLTVLVNDGVASFAREDFELLGFYLWESALADLDGDGDPDAMTSEALSGQLSLQANASAGGQVGFDFPQLAGIGGFPRHILPADLDDDCAIDLVICDIAGHRVQWLINLTPQQGCAATDLDGDGVVGSGDLQAVFAAWGQGGGRADLDRDGIVGPFDVLRVLGTHGPRGSAGRGMRSDVSRPSSDVHATQAPMFGTARAAAQAAERIAGQTAERRATRGAARDEASFWSGIEPDGSIIAAHAPASASMALQPGERPLEATGAALGCGPGAGDCFEPHGGPGCEWSPCCDLVCDVMPYCCTDGWDERCVAMAQMLCEPTPACQVSLAPCDHPQRDGGCADRTCCELVCAIDPFCCGGAWDAICVAAAAELCGRDACGVLVEAAIEEGETCLEPINDGCDQPDAPAFGSIAVGETVSGRSWARGRRDVDWYRLDLASPTTVTISLRAEFPAEVSVLEGDCTQGFAAVSRIAARPCESGAQSLALPAGTWYLSVAPGRDGLPIVRGIACAEESPDVPRAFRDRYALSVSGAK